MEAEIRLVDGLTTVGMSDSNHWMPIDGPKDFGGHEGANKPVELLLISLGSCTAMDVLSILGKMRQPYEDLTVRITAEQREEHPRIFTSIKLRYLVKGKVDPGKLEKAISLSQERYCPISAMLRDVVPIEWEYEMVNGVDTKAKDGE